MKKYRVLSVISAVSVSVSSLLNGSVAMAESMNRRNVQGSESLLISQLFETSVDFVPPLDDGAPTHSRGGATRDPECDALQVLPESGSGLTASERPMVQAYFQAGVKQVWMQVKADDGSEVYTYGEEEYFVLPEGKGFAEVPLPDALGSLTPGKPYSWEMVLLCNRPFGPSSPKVSGGIRRVETVASLGDSESMSLSAKMSAYAESGLWYDYIAALTVMKQENPGSTQLMQNWEAALRAVNLDMIFDEFEMAGR